MNRDEVHHYVNRLSIEDLQLFDERWSGRSELCKELLLEQLLVKDVGMDALALSWIRGCLVVKTRQEDKSVYVMH